MHDSMPGGVVVAQGTLNPLTQVRILAGQPAIRYKMMPKVSNSLGLFLIYLTYIAMTLSKKTPLTLLTSGEIWIGDAVKVVWQIPMNTSLTEPTTCWYYGRSLALPKPESTEGQEWTA